MLRRSLLAVLLLCLAAPALAQDAPPHEGEGLRMRQPAAAKPAAPKAAPAKAAEHKALAPKTPRGPAVKDDKKPYLRSLDANHDGRVSREEYMAGSRKRFAKADANRDGVISTQEGKAVKAKQLEKEAKADAKRRAQGKPVKPHRKGDKPPKPYLSTFDKDHDGRVSQKEYLSRREKKFAEMDLNHDGVISREEARAAKQKLLERRAERKENAKERRLRKMEEYRQKTEGQKPKALSSPGPELTAPASPPPPPKPAQPQPAPEPQENPLTPLTPTLPAQTTPET